MTEMLVDRDIGVIILDESNTGIGPRAAMNALADQFPEQAALVKWTVNTQGSGGRSGSIFERDRYLTPGSVFDQMRVAHDAAENDDIVSGVVELTEALAFSRITFQAEDIDQEDIWNQIAEEVDLDARIREMWREMFVVSQFYACNWWGERDIKVRGRSPDTKIKKKKVFSGLTVPIGLTMLDPLKVMPVGNLMFNQERLAYIADFTEVDMLDAAAAGDPEADPVARQIIVGRYTPSDLERKQMMGQEIPSERLFLLNPQFVWRHTETRSAYQRFATVRMKSIFELLDLKHQLRQMDRAHLIGGTNFIVLVKKGSKERPATQPEIDNLQAQVRTVARVPVIVGDDRLSIEIITPKQDSTLDSSKYGVIDSRITARLFQMFMVSHTQAGGRSDDSVKIAKVVAKGLASRRHMLRRAIEKHFVKPAMEANSELTDMPSLRFHPTRIDLDFDAATVQYLLDLRDRGDISRDTILNELDFDQADEAMKREREAELYDDVFTMTNVPWSAAGPAHNVPVGPGGKPKELNEGDGSGSGTTVQPHGHDETGQPVALPSNSGGAGADGGGRAADPRTAGRRQGGRRSGGGAAPGTGQGQAPRGKPKERP